MWLAIGAVPVRLSFVLDAYSLPSATLVALITWATVVVIRWVRRRRG